MFESLHVSSCLGCVRIVVLHVEPSCVIFHIAATSCSSFLVYHGLKRHKKLVKTFLVLYHLGMTSKCKLCRKTMDNLMFTNLCQME